MYRIDRIVIDTCDTTCYTDDLEKARQLAEDHSEGFEPITGWAEFEIENDDTKLTEKSICGLTSEKDIWYTITEIEMNKWCI